MSLTLHQRWRLFLASLHRSRTEREIRQWLALKSASELLQINAHHSGPAVIAELHRRGLGSICVWRRSDD